MNTPKWKDILHKTGLFLATWALALTLNSCDGNQKKVKEDSDPRIAGIESVFSSDTLTTEEKLAIFDEKVDEKKYNFLFENNSNIIEKKDRLQWYVNAYNELESRKGDKIYIVSVSWVPSGYSVYFFSEEEQKEYLKNIKEQIDNYEKASKADSPIDYAWPIWLWKIEKKVLDEETFRSIVEENATNPLGGVEYQSFRSEKLRELQDKSNK